MCIHIYIHGHIVEEEIVFDAISMMNMMIVLVKRRIESEYLHFIALLRLILSCLLYGLNSDKINITHSLAD